MTTGAVPIVDDWIIIQSSFDSGLNGGISICPDQCSASASKVVELGLACVGALPKVIEPGLENRWAWIVNMFEIVL